MIHYIHRAEDIRSKLGTEHTARLRPLSFLAFVFLGTRVLCFV